MKKVLLIFILFIILILGIDMGSKNSVTQADIVDNKIEEFEKRKIESNTTTVNTVSGNVSNNAAKRVEKIIEKAFDYSFGLIEKLIN